jgi:hypothetical protein
MEGKTMDERQMHQWWILISEKERRDMISDTPGCYSYGAIKMLQQLPEDAKAKVRAAYTAHLERVAELERLHPAS